LETLPGSNSEAIQVVMRNKRSSKMHQNEALQLSTLTHFDSLTLIGLAA
jgi:hypothetical protein